MRPLLAVLAVLGLAGGAAAADDLLSRALANAGRDHGTRLLELARAAQAAGQAATARQLRERVLEVEPDHLRARLGLGFKRGKTGAWERTPERTAEFAAAADTDPAVAEEFARKAVEVERRWVVEQVRVCQKFAGEEQGREVLGRLLLRFPEDEGVRGALGHVRVHGRWTPPGLVGLAERFPEVRARWQALATRDVEAEQRERKIAVPGLAAELDVYPAGPRALATTDTPEIAAQYARGVLRTQSLLKALLGSGERDWDPKVVLFLAPEAFDLMVRALHPGPEQADFYLRYDNYEHKEFYAIRSYEPLGAMERYAHGAGHLTAFERSAPPVTDGGGARDAEAYAWWREGVGYLVSFEVTDRGYLQFVSIEESSAKRVFTREVPETKTRAACLAWLREQVAAGTAYPLEEVCGMRLNALDFCASFQAWSFVRLLAAWDADAFQRLAESLRATEPGSTLERSDRALKACFGRGVEEWAPLWRDFVLEVDREGQP